MTRISSAERRRIFGEPGATKNLVQVLTPWDIRVRVHRLLAERFIYACDLAAGFGWDPRRIDSYANRAVRGSTSTSLHAWGLAFDFFDRPLPQPVDVWGPTNAPPAPFRSVFKACGFALGAEFGSRKDFPHIEWADGLPAPTATVRKLSVTEVDLGAPLIKPITVTRLGEAEGVRLSTHLVEIPALDKDGRGHYDIPYPLERVVDITPHGSSPPDDGYWPVLTLAYQPRGEVTRVTLAGAPGGRVGFWFKLVEQE